MRAISVWSPIVLPLLHVFMHHCVHICTLRHTQGGVEKHRVYKTRHVFEEYPPPGHGPGSASPQPRCLMGRGVRRTPTPRKQVGVVHRLPSRPLPLGRGCDWTVGTGEVVPPPGVIPQAAGADDGRGRTFPSFPPLGGGEGAFVVVRWLAWLDNNSNNNNDNCISSKSNNSNSNSSSITVT